MNHPVGRRHLLAGAGAAFCVGALDGCSVKPVQPGLSLPPLHAGLDRITQITVCTRPFRAEGPRLDVETIGAKSVVHNYGHGGSGWSLSWGSSAIAIRKALASGERDLAVIGCGAMGLTSAILAQRAGAKVTIYAKDLPPNVRSSLASGIWSPDSRICFEDKATPEFKQRWQEMSRNSFQTYQTLLGLPGQPIEWIDLYNVGDGPERVKRHSDPPDGRPRFANLQREMTPELVIEMEDIPPGHHPFGDRYTGRSSAMMFNISAYSRMLLADFQSFGGRIEIREFHSPADFAGLPQKVVVNCTGYGAKALFADPSLTPVRGQLARMVPDKGVEYGLYHHQVSFLPRRDGWVFQLLGQDDYYGYGDETAVPDRAEAETAVRTIAGLFTA